MKLDQLLKDIQAPIQDNGFTDRVMRRLPGQASNEWLDLFDVPIFELSVLAGILALTFDLWWARVLQMVDAVLIPLTRIDSSSVFVIGTIVAISGYIWTVVGELGAGELS